MLSIIIPTLNEEEYLPRLLESIKEQSYLDYEIIVSDAGSEDGTVRVAKQNNCKIVVDSKNRHPSFQRNNGARIAQGDTLLFLDADTVLVPDFLLLALSEFEKRKLDIAGSYFRFHPNRFLYSIYAFLYNSFCFFRQYKFPASVGAGILIRKKLHDQINGFDTSIYLAEDYDYCCRAAAVGKFRMIRSRKILYSSRRLEKEGVIKGALKWLSMARYTMFNKKIKKEIIKYEMGGK